MRDWVVFAKILLLGGIVIAVITFLNRISNLSTMDPLSKKYYLLGVLITFLSFSPHLFIIGKIIRKFIAPDLVRIVGSILWFTILIYALNISETSGHIYIVGTMDSFVVLLIFTEFGLSIIRSIYYKK
jgi:hypothetical protein